MPHMARVSNELTCLAIVYFDKPTLNTYIPIKTIGVFQMSVLSAPYMHDEAAAFAHVESDALGGWSGLPALWRRGSRLSS